MLAEYPSSHVEAFRSSGQRIFHPDDVDRCRKDCRPPRYISRVTGTDDVGKLALHDIGIFHFDDASDPENNLAVWQMPCPLSQAFPDRYVITVDIGGRSSRSDPSDILVLDRLRLVFPPFPEARKAPEVVAEWHGHTDIDLLAWKAAQIAAFYHKGLLVIESNTADSRKTDGYHFESILDEIVRFYPNLYCRTSPQEIRAGKPLRWGFHTNVATKPLIVNHQVKLLRENAFIERSSLALDEFDDFELKNDGFRTGAIDGKHDDRVITRCIGAYICATWPKPPLPLRSLFFPPLPSVIV
jgi:hypothetical protein